MPRRASATSYGGSHGNDPRLGDKHAAAVKGGAANHPATLRLKMRNALAKRIDKLADIADGRGSAPMMTKDGPVEMPPSFGDQLRALDTLAKYGVGTQQEHMGKDGGAINVRVVRDPA